MACGDVLSLEDLQTAKKHQIFEAEVITGKTGGVASGADIATATNAATGQVQKTLPQILSEIGFKPGTGDFTTGFMVMPEQRDYAWFDPVSQEWYSYLGTIPTLGFVVAPGTNPVGDPDWRVTSEHLFTQDGAGAVTRQAQDKMREVISVADFGASPTNTSAQNLAAFLAAEVSAGAGPIYVPDGVFQLTTPMALGYTAEYYGHGFLKFDKAEIWRRGGSGGNGLPDKYTLMFEYVSQSDVYITLNGVPQPITTWVNDTTFIGPSSTSSDAIRYGVNGGMLRLSMEPESPRSYNSFAGGGGKVQPSLPNETAAALGMFNVGFGSRTLQNITTSGNNSGFGSRCMTSLKEGGNNTAMGFQALYRAESVTDNTAIGSVAMEHNLTGNANTAVGALAIASNETGNFNTGVGVGAGGDMRDGDFNTSIGYYAHGNNSTASPVAACTSIGAYANRYGRGNNTVAIGYRALAGNAPTTGSDNIGVGFFTGRNIVSGEQNVLIGTGVASAASSQTFKRTVMIGHEAGANSNADDTVAIGYHALNAITTAIRCTAVGSGAMQLSTGNDSTAVGYGAGSSNTSGTENTVMGVMAGELGSTGSGNTDIGSRAGQLRTTGGFNTNVGRQAGQNNKTGNNNTNIGVAAGKVTQDGTNATAFVNTTCIGAASAVSGDNQVQLGNSATTTYVYGTVQNRSDARDKADIRDTELGIEFIMGLRPVDGRWDMRDDYFEEYEQQVGIDENAQPVFETHVRKIPKDGSKKRERFHHWFIAQEVKELCDSLGVEFGGYQDHSVNGGCDVLSLGYDEFIPPMTKAIQQCWQRMDELEKRIAALE